ncbi:MAG: hypothetical protein AW09_001515 [Candidatus Accumulibacter phosphatis]|uniref:Uncharacterized protein n=1 Tax=Candidatus Accumulibacter phosphatis TaxID=327160 RepID=A0A080LZ20_9PROT|nr:MAG: hypothetical protein AW09_001515 [Candidatus Accumulibacter phosphatis]
MAPQDAAVESLQRCQWQQRARRQCGPERHDAWLHAGLQHAHQTLTDIDRHRRLRGRAGVWLGARRCRMAHEVPGLRPGFDEPTVLQLVQRLQYR